MNNNPNNQEALMPNGLKPPVIHRCGADQIKIIPMPLDLKPINGNNGIKEGRVIILQYRPHYVRESYAKYPNKPTIIKTNIIIIIFLLLFP